MIEAVGTIFLSLKTKRVMLGLRSAEGSHPLTWSFFGGKVEQGESLGVALAREIKEELIFVPKILKTYPLDNFISNDEAFKYASFVSIINSEFHPILNDENDGYAWVKIGAWPKPLHAGTKLILHNKNNVNKLTSILQRELKESPGVSPEAP